MTRTALFTQSMIAVNVALPLALSFGLKHVPGSLRTTLFWICVIGLFALNQYIAHRMSEFRKWIWGVQGVNLVSTGLFGAIGLATAVSSIWLFIKLAFGLT